MPDRAPLRRFLQLEFVNADVDVNVNPEAKVISMTFKPTALVALLLTATVLGQALLIQTTGAHAADQMDKSSEAARVARFETLLESLRQELKIPAYSAAIVKNQKVIWAKGFGFADVENKIPAT